MTILVSLALSLTAGASLLISAAVPGDELYPIKAGVTTGVQAVLAAPKQVWMELENMVSVQSSTTEAGGQVEVSSEDKAAVSTETPFNLGLKASLENEARVKAAQ